MNMFTFLSAELGEQVVITFGHSLWQGLVVALIAACAAGVLRRRNPNVRYGIYLVALALMIICLPVTFYFVSQSSDGHSLSDEPIANVGALLVDPTTEAIWESENTAIDMPPFDGLVDMVNLPPLDDISDQQFDSPEFAWQSSKATPVTGVSKAAARVSGLSQQPWMEWLSWAYMIGVALMIGRLFVSLLGIQRLCNATSPVESQVILSRLEALVSEMGLRVAPSIAVSQRVVTPTVVGLFRPLILLPVSLATSLSADEVTAILAHELAHIRRHDVWVNLFQRCIEAALFFNPAVWYLSRCLSTEREYCCDDIASSHGLGSVRYAELLLRLAEVRSRKMTLAEQQVTLAVAGDRPSRLRRRIARLIGLEEELSMRMTRRGTWTLTVVAILVGLLCLTPLPAETTAEKATDTSAQNESTVKEEVTKAESKPAETEKSVPTETKTNVDIFPVPHIVDFSVPADEVFPIAGSESVPLTKVAEPSDQSQPTQLKEVAVDEAEVSKLTKKDKAFVGTWEKGTLVQETQLVIRPDQTFRWERFLSDRGLFEGQWDAKKDGELILKGRPKTGQEEVTKHYRWKLNYRGDLELYGEGVSKAERFTRLSRVDEDATGSLGDSKGKSRNREEIDFDVPRLTQSGKLMLGTWKQDLLNEKGTLTISPNGAFQWDRIDPNRKQETGRWKIDGQFQLVLIGEETTRFRISAIGDKELKLEQISTGTKSRLISFKRVVEDADAPILTEKGKLLLGTWDQGVYVRQARLAIRADGTFSRQQFSGERSSIDGRWDFNIQGELVLTPNGLNVGTDDILRYSIENVDSQNLRMIRRDGGIVAHATAFTRVVEKNTKPPRSLAKNSALSKPLSETEKKLLGSWEAKFNDAGKAATSTLTFSADRTVLFGSSESNGVSYVRRWWVGEDGKLFNISSRDSEATPYAEMAILSVNDRTLLLESLDKSSDGQVITYTRVGGKPAGTSEVAKSKSPAKIKPLTDLEKKLLGTWEAKFSDPKATAISTLTFAADRKLVFGRVESDGISSMLRWRIGEDGKLFTVRFRDSDATAHAQMAIVSVNEKELKLKSLNSSNENEVYTYTRVAETKAEPVDEAKKSPVKIKPLSDLEKRLVGTWGRSSFLSYGTQTFSSDRRVVVVGVTPKSDPLIGRWHVDGTATLVYTVPQGEGKPDKLNRYRIVAATEQGLTLEDLSPVARNKKYTYSRLNSERAKSIRPSDEKPAKLKPLSKLEKKLLGTWGRSSFLSYGTQTFSSDRRVVVVGVTPKSDPLIGRWHVDGTATLVYELPEADGERYKKTRYRIELVDEKELKLGSLDPVSRYKTYTYSRVKTPQASQSKASQNLLPLGKEVERTIYEMELFEGRDYCLDLDTGKFHAYRIEDAKKYDEKRIKHSMYQWIAATGSDVLADPSDPVKGLTGVNMIVIPTYGPVKDQEYSKERLDSIFAEAKPGSPIAISGASTLPVSYFFQTREGSRGVLHIIGHVKEGVKIRYKLLSHGMGQKKSTASGKSFEEDLPELKSVWDASETSQPAAKPASKVSKVSRAISKRDWPDTQVGKLLQDLDQLQRERQTGKIEWCRKMRELILLGPDAVPELIAALDETPAEAHWMLCTIPFAMRGIGDKRAIPSLIRAIPRCYEGRLSGGSYYVKDEELLDYFMKLDASTSEKKWQGFHFGRPANEVFVTLERWTGTDLGWKQIIFVIPFEQWDNPRQKQLKAQVYPEFAQRWARWWEKHWQDHVDDPKWSKVNLPEFKKVKPLISEIEQTQLLKYNGTAGSMYAESVYDVKSTRSFYDLDTGRWSELPRHLMKNSRKSFEESETEIVAWATEQGFDLMGKEIEHNGEKHVVLQPINLKAWEVPQSYWQAREPRSVKEIIDSGRPVGKLLVHYGDGRYDLEQPGEFFYITSEGTPGHLLLGVESKESDPADADYVNGKIRKKSNRFIGRKFDMGVLVNHEPEDS